MADYLPEWDDNERMAVVMGSLPLSNGSARTARIVLWSAGIHQWCRTTKSLRFTVKDATMVFRRGSQIPECLPEVIKLMIKEDELMPLDHLPSPAHETWRSWGHRVLIATPTKMVWSQVSSLLWTDSGVEQQLVNTVVLKELCDQLQKDYWAEHGESNVISFSSLYNQFASVVGSIENLQLIVDALQRRGQATVVTHEKSLFLKLAGPGDVKKPVIEQFELAELQLNLAAKELKKKISTLDMEIISLKAEAKSAVLSGSKVNALSALRKKKRVEATMTSHIAALDNVEACIDQLHESQLNKSVLGAFKSGVESLKTAVGGGLADDTTATMDELQQVLEECEDIKDVISAGMKLPGDLEDDDLEEELNLLLQGGKEGELDEHSSATHAAGLPDVPLTDPLQEELGHQFSRLAASTAK